MSLITRTYTFTDGTTAYGSQVESEIQNIATVINGLDAGTTTWDIVKVVNGSSTPLIVDNSSGSNSIADFKANGVSKFTLSATGGITAVTGCIAALPMGANKITGLANGTASTDAVAYGQLKYFQTVQVTSTTQTTTTSSTFTAATNISASITPSSSSNRIKVTIVSTGAASTASTLIYTIKRGSTELSGVAGGFGHIDSFTANPFLPIAVSYIDSPSTTSSTTYQLFFASSNNTNTVTMGRSDVMSTVILEEIV